MRILHPEGWKPARGYANGISAAGRTIFVGGQVGWNADQIFVSDEFVAQCAQALENVVAVLACDGAGPEHFTRLTWYVIDREEYLANQRALGEVYRRIIGRHYPAMTLVQVVALAEARARVEIEAVAVVEG